MEYKKPKQILIQIKEIYKVHATHIITVHSKEELTQELTQLKNLKAYGINADPKKCKIHYFEIKNHDIMNID